MALKKTILFLLFIIISVTIYYGADNYKEELILKYQNKNYQEIQKQNKLLFTNVYLKYKNESIYKTKQLIKSLNVVDKILNPQNKFEYYNSDNSVIKLFDIKGLEIFSNDIEEYETDNKIKRYIEYFLKNPMYTTDLITNQKGMFLSILIPIFKDDKLIGVFEINKNFDLITTQLNDKNLKLVILLNKRDSNNIDLNLSYSRLFTNQNYVVNKNSDKYYLKILEQSSIIKDANTNQTIDYKGGVIINRVALDNNIANAYIIKSMDDINHTNIDFIILMINLIVVLSIFVIFFIFYFLTKSSETKNIIMENKILLEDNKKLKVLSDNLDFNEKKLSNLFNLQPNIMFISNGFKIVQVNKRFMGFFRRYKSFENFKNEHNCISELFEETDLPHYVTSNMVDSKDWLEYILENPKKLYKTIMSVDGEAHHFIIKVNEMDFVKKFQERYIVVAFVDITQDMSSKQNERSDTCEINSDFDISFMIEHSISLTLYEYSNITPTKQAIFKAKKEDQLDFDCVYSKLKFITKGKELNWKVIFPVDTLSYIQNIITFNYDAKITTVLDDDLKDIAFELVNNIAINLTHEINNSNNHSIDDLEYKHDKSIESYKGDSEHIYKFIIFIDNKEIDIYIEFDNDSLFYIRQIQMLGVLFN
ncbi:MAG: hypothetical protein U9Q20_09035 [Campylobacterota bacterium]|nr:hypothetical protein [Campylobacterota bacterium]